MATARLRQLAVAPGGPGLMSVGAPGISYLLHREHFSGR